MFAVCLIGEALTLFSSLFIDRLTCLCFFTSTLILQRIQLWPKWTPLHYHTPSLRLKKLRNLVYRSMNLRQYQEYLFLCGQSSVDVKAQTHGKSLAQYCMIQAAKLPCVPTSDNIVSNIAAIESFTSSTLCATNFLVYK